MRGYVDVNPCLVLDLPYESVLILFQKVNELILDVFPEFGYDPDATI